MNKNILVKEGGHKSYQDRDTQYKLNEPFENNGRKVFKVGGECKREMDLAPKKRARVCLACKSKNGLSNVF